MAKAILISIITFVISIFVEANVGARWNMPGIGCILAVVIMGGFILAAIEHKNKQNINRQKFLDGTQAVQSIRLIRIYLTLSQTNYTAKTEIK